MDGRGRPHPSHVTLYGGDVHVNGPAVKPNGPNMVGTLRVTHLFDSLGPDLA